MTGDEKRLVEAASDVRANAHAPYSGYRVGAAVLDENGKVHTGCNVENAAYPEGTCAEANAIGSMVAAGGKRIVAISAVVGAVMTSRRARPAAVVGNAFSSLPIRAPGSILIGDRRYDHQLFDR